MERGIVYVLANSAMPGLFKVGRTTRDVNKRARELSSATGLPTPFIVVYEQEFADCVSAETFAHTYLEVRGYRTTNNREFFNAPCSDIIKSLLAYDLTTVSARVAGTQKESVVGALLKFYSLIKHIPLRDDIDHDIVKQISTLVEAANDISNSREIDVIIVSALTVFSVALSAAYDKFGAPQSEIVKQFLEFSTSLKEIPLSENSISDDFVVDDSAADMVDLLLPYRVEPWFDVIEQAEKMYEGDSETPSNHAEGFRLYRQAARLGSLSAYAAIARIYEHGRGVVQSERKQMHWLSEGAKRGCMVCYWRMSLLFVKQEDLLNAQRSLTQFVLDLDGRDRASGQRIDVVWRHMWGVYKDCVSSLFLQYRWHVKFNQIYRPLFSRLAIQIEEAALQRLESTVSIEDRAALLQVIEYIRSAEMPAE